MTVSARSAVQRRTDLTFDNSQSDFRIPMKVLELEKEIADDIDQIQTFLK